MSSGTEMDMAHFDGETFLKGSNGFYPEEQPVHQVTVAAFELARYAVTNAQFAAFAADTGYITVAEQPLDPAAFGGASLASTAPGSLVFTPTRGPVNLADWRQWWTWVPGASWRQPYGPGSTIEGKEDHPVVQVAYPDAQTFARWCGMRLPSEAEWEYAARGGLDGATYVWGRDPQDGAAPQAQHHRSPVRVGAVRSLSGAVRNYTWAGLTLPIRRDLPAAARRALGRGFAAKSNPVGLSASAVLGAAPDDPDHLLDQIVVPVTWPRQRDR